MALELQIKKRLASYTLSLAFHTSNGPLAVLGPSGAGKTMTLRCIAGIERPDSGRIALNGRVLFDSAKNIDIPSRDRRVALLFQNHALFPHLTVAENIAFGLDRLPRPEQQARVERQIHALHLGGLESRYPAALSGGEQQRTALARALAIDPGALLLDEPLTALDTHLRSQIEQQLLETLSHFRGATLFVTHNIEEAYRIGEQILVLSKGRAEAFGPKEEIFRHPPTLEVARVTGCKNFSRARRASEGRVEALDWGCTLRVAQAFAGTPAYVAIRAHHVRVHPAQKLREGNAENIFPCWLAAMTETPFRVTLDLRIGTEPSSPVDYHLQAEVFKQEWESFRDLPQPWAVELAADLVFLLPQE